jgi:NADPH-dependent 2,4-dienoyl-CoA reductase/sulfur reductase-like enzyme
VGALPGTVLIAGAGLAGSRCAEALRAGGHRGRILVLGEEPDAPYERPALSKSFLAGRQSAPSLALREPSHWRARGIELATNIRIAAVDPRGAATTADGSTIEWDSLVLATGSRPRRLPGDDRPGVHRLRTLADAAALSRDLVAGRRLAIVGAGFIGLEVASTARELGLDVTLVTSDEVPLARAAGPVVGALVAERARAAGVRLLVGARGATLCGQAAGRIESVSLDGGGEVPCDVALVAIGAEPASELAHGLVPIAADGGVATDAAGRTDQERVFACGDVASAWRPWLGECRSIGHWTSAAVGARAAAAAILGAPAVGPDLPYAWSDAFGWRLQQVGGPPPAEAELVLQTCEDGFEASYRIGGELRCAVVANQPQRMASLRRELGPAWAIKFGENVGYGRATGTAPR